MAAINVRRLEFARAPGDVVVTGRVTLDPDGPTYAASMLWAPQAESWYFSLRLTTGEWVVRGIALRDRTDCLLGVATTGRPRGAIISYDPRGRGDPMLTSYSRDDVRLLYLPDGFDPADFSLYASEVV